MAADRCTTHHICDCQARELAALRAVAEAAQAFSDEWERWKWKPRPDWDDVLDAIGRLQDALDAARPAPTGEGGGE